MRHLFCACVFVPLRFYTILLWKPEFYGSHLSHIFEKHSISIEKPSFLIKKPSILMEKLSILIENLVF